MRSTIFVTLSVMVHLACITALAVGQFRKTQATNKVVSTEVVSQDISMEETATAPKVDSQVKEAKVVAAKSVAAKAVAQKAKPVAQKKVSKPKAKVQELPPKVKSSEPEELDPQIEANNTVSIAHDTSEDSNEDVLTPVKEVPPIGVEADTSEMDPAAAADIDDQQTEAASDDLQKGVEDPSPVEETTGDAPAAVADETPATAPQAATQVKAGSAKTSAISYLQLKQLPGNKGPVYPLNARLQKRQGQVELLYKVTKEGRVTDIQVAKSSGYKDLDDAAMKAIAKFRFQPGQEGWARHPVRFALKGSGETLPSRLRTVGAAND